jgi:hypothetical protein
MGAYSFWPVRLFVCLSAKKINIGHIFSKVSDRAFIFHMCVLYDKTFSIGTNVFDLVTLTLKFDPLFKNFDISHIFSMARDRAFIFHM